MAESERALRVLETSHPPVYYIPHDDVQLQYLQPSGRHTVCEFKGRADYYGLVHDGRVSPRRRLVVPGARRRATSRSPAILPSIRARVDACFVDDERVQPQAGDFYGGWITAEVVGPFKGGPGTAGW